MANVVAIADIGQPQALQPPKALLESKHVGQRLAGMLAVAQRVDHWHAGVARQLLDRSMAKDARRNHLDPTAQVARDIRHTLAPAHVDVVGRQVAAVPAYLSHAGLKGHARAKRWLL